MPTLTVKNLSPEVHSGLKARAALHHRSLNSEILATLESSLRPSRVDPEEFLDRIRALRGETSGAVSAEDLQTFKNEGRS